MSSEARTDDWFLDSALRPALWADYVGQENIKDNLKLILGAARERGQPPEHLLFYGPPGLGKTTLAHLIAKEMNAPIKVTAGPAIEKVGDLASILTNLSPGDFLFIDEVHRLPKTIEEVLYPALESGVLNIIIGKGPGARMIQLDLPPFTLIAATTRIALLSSPLRSRFSGGTFRLEFYQPEEIAKIIGRSATILETALEGKAANEIASRSRFTPRLANHLLKRCRDFAQLKKTPINLDSVKSALNLIGVDERGLNQSDRRLMAVMIEKFNGGPIGLGTIAAAAAEEEATVADVYEPYLMQIGFLERTPRGRQLTKAAYEHLGYDYPKDQQGKLI